MSDQRVRSTVEDSQNDRVTGSSSSSGSGGTKNIRTTVPGSSAGVRPVNMDSAVDSIAQTLSTASISRSSSHGHPAAATAATAAADCWAFKSTNCIETDSSQGQGPATET
ncbi:hypothetical protein BASA62_005591 [Batrachochytrium salamandrivorans]|nr:hypothetical protein BASA62_005591 [Batrachochytrium salamandrivorans]